LLQKTPRSRFQHYWCPSAQVRIVSNRTLASSRFFLVSHVDCGNTGHIKGEGNMSMSVSFYSSFSLNRATISLSKNSPHIKGSVRQRTLGSSRDCQIFRQPWSSYLRDNIIEDEHEYLVGGHWWLLVTFCDLVLDTWVSGILTNGLFLVLKPLTDCIYF